MQPINSFHASIKRKLAVHIGMLRECVQKYLDWLVFETYINELDPKDKIAIFVEARGRVRGRFKVKE